MHDLSNLSNCKISLNILFKIKNANKMNLAPQSEDQGAKSRLN